MSIRRNTDEKYRVFWQLVDDAAERVAQWPSWMIDRPPQWSVDGTTDDNTEPVQEALSATVEKAPPENRSLGLPFGLDRGTIHVADDFDVLPDDIRAAFEGNGT